MGYRVKLVRSLAGASFGQLRTLEGLGLRKLGQERLLLDTPAVRGMVFKVRHLVFGESVKDEPVIRARMKARRIRVRDASRLAAG